MTQKWGLWVTILIALMGALLLLNYSKRVEYITLNDYRVNPSSLVSVKCADFLTQKEAQEYFDKNKEMDISKLDGDKDGVVCEGLP